MAREALMEPATGRSWRLILVVGALMLGCGSASLTWWWSTLSGLPDVGDPFDVAAFADRPVPDEENAFVLYRRATARLGEEPSEMVYDWARAGPVEKGWLDRNREALELWQRGTERPGALYFAPRSLTLMTRLTVVQQLRTCARLAQLEGGRLEAEGDLEGAWRCYRAIFRSGRHVGHRGLWIQRLVGKAFHDIACRRLTTWASDPRVTPAMLRRALDAAIADYAMTGPISDNLKVEYIASLRTFADPALARTCLVDAGSGYGNSEWYAREVGLFSMTRAFKQEPERSRRVSRLIYANLLTACDLPPGRRPPVACSLPDPNDTSGTKRLVDLYELGGSAPAQARALSPEAVLGWYRTTLYTSHLTPVLVNLIETVDRERVAQASLVIALANRLYEIERGRFPETVEELVGPYLKALPEGHVPAR